MHEWFQKVDGALLCPKIDWHIPEKASEKNMKVGRKNLYIQTFYPFHLCTFKKEIILGPQYKMLCSKKLTLP